MISTLIAVAVPYENKKDRGNRFLLLPLSFDVLVSSPGWATTLAMSQPNLTTFAR